MSENDEETSASATSSTTTASPPPCNPSHAAAIAAAPRLELLTLPRGLNNQSRHEWVPFLAKLQEVFNEKHQGQVVVWPGPVSFKQPAHRDCAREVNLTDINWDNSYTLHEWLNADTKKSSDHLISLAPMREWTARPWHCWVLKTVHPADGTNGETLAIYDTNTMEANEKECVRQALGHKWSCVEELRKFKGGGA
ncbi:hypothetical protein B0H10DRAFT_1941953 [Mycena sp. CBHHK59/15]|nr:hypothetical protein B0H10DRAFT_1941953 [Mycena sp. CBHHK59/15]